jgi:LPS export ABC transporter protein LptC
MENRLLLKRFFQYGLLSAILVGCYTVVYHLSHKNVLYLTNIQKSAERVSAYRFDHSGQPSKVLQVALVYQHHDSYVLEDIQARTHSNLGSWILDASHGIWKRSQHLIELDKGVFARLKNNEIAGTIITQAITVDTQQQTATNDLPVTIQTEQGNIEATGIFADLDKQTIELRSNIKGSYIVDP